MSNLGYAGNMVPVRNKIVWSTGWCDGNFEQWNGSIVLYDIVGASVSGRYELRNSNYERASLYNNTRILLGLMQFNGHVWSDSPAVEEN